jgi:hypothetical protein
MSEPAIRHEEYFCSAHNRMNILCLLTMQDGFIASGLSVCRNPEIFSYLTGKTKAKAAALRGYYKATRKREMMQNAL